MTVAAGDMLQVRVTYSLPESSRMENVFHFKVTSDGGPPAADSDVVATVEAIMYNCYQELIAWLSEDIPQLLFSVDVIHFVDGQWETFYHVGEGDTGVNPASTGDPLPPATAGLVTLYPIYMRHRGAKYIGGMTETANQDDGTPFPDVLLDLLAFAAFLIGDEYVFPGSPPQNALYYVIPVRNAELWNVPTGALARNQWATQRRRGKSVGS